VTKIIQNAEKNRSLRNRQIRESTTKIETQIAQVLCRKASATKIPGKDHWHQTAVTTFTENGPFQDYTRKTALFRATQIFQKVTKVVVNSQINVSFSPAPI
jgi:pyruvate kinase